MRAAWILLALLAAPAHAGGDLPGLELPSCDPARAHCVGIRLRVAVDDRGALVASHDWLVAQLAEANRLFEPIDVGFEIVDRGVVPAFAARLEDRKERDRLGALIRGTVIDVFITGQLDDVDTAGAVAYGVTWRRGTRKFIIVSTQARDRTLAHELGHFFGLPHSTYPISIMNKTARTEPPPEDRRFADEELPPMKLRLAALLRAKVIVNLRARK